MRDIPASMDPTIVAEIDARLDTIERDEGVTIGFAIESGSRAWGFPSPDSDYDCRFVYVRKPEGYLTLFPARDVIETPLTAVFDVNGWDLAKALKLMLAGNAVIVEWLTSPIVYRAHTPFVAEFRDLAGLAADRTRIARHYLHLGRSILETKLGDLDDVPIKKIFYALRPAVALRWMRHQTSERLPPMNFQALCEGADLPVEIADTIAKLLEEKARTREMGRGPMPGALRDLVTRELDEAEQTHSEATGRSVEDMERADAFFRRWVARFK